MTQEVELTMGEVAVIAERAERRRRLARLVALGVLSTSSWEQSAILAKLGELVGQEVPADGR